MQHTLILIPCKSGRVTLLAIFQPLSWTLWILTVERGGSKLTWDKVVQNDSWDLSWTVGLLEMGLKSLGKHGLMSHKYPSKIKTKSKDLNSPKLCSIHVLEELLGSADTVAAQRQTPVGDEVRTEVVLVHQGENLLWQVRCIDQSVSRVKERKNFSSNTPSCLQPTQQGGKDWNVTWKPVLVCVYGMMMCASDVWGTQQLHTRITLMSAAVGSTLPRNHTFQTFT